MVKEKRREIMTKGMTQEKHIYMQIYMYLLYFANKQPLYVLPFRSFFLLFETLNMEISLMENCYNLFIFRKMEM